MSTSSASPENPRNRCILVADDDQGVRELVTASLSDLGCHVLTAPNGSSALEVLRGAAPKIDLLLTDLEMPELDGLALAKLAKSECLVPRISVMTGLQLNHHQARLLHELAIDFLLLKPFRIDDLRQAVLRSLGIESNQQPQPPSTFQAQVQEEVRPGDNIHQLANA